MKKVNLFPLILILIMLLGFSLSRTLFTSLMEEPIDTSRAIELINGGHIKKASLVKDKLTLIDDDGKGYRTIIPMMLQNDFYNDHLKDQVEEKNIVFAPQSSADEGLFSGMLPYLIMGLGFFFILNMLFRQARVQNNNVDDFSKSKAKRFQPSNGKTITFKDVAGLEEEKVELMEIVDFLKSPRKYANIGARIPKGVLLVGPPGTGKTYISRAVAGEAGVPFFSISGSEFLEMFVGVGASRVRDLFKEAKANAPCIIFIDEIDAVGRKRGTGLGGGHDEREQTLNQLLVEMDGFEKNEGIIMMAATNRPDILDDALLRPGRFDRTVHIGLPDVRGREEILEVHAKDKPMGDDVDLNNIARRTPGFSPADLENLLNEAALLSARANRSSINKDMMEEASIKVIAGPEKKSKLITPEEKKLVSFHEAGHAVIGYNLKKTEPVHMITIVPRGAAGGFTYSVPDEERYYHTRSMMIDEMITLLGGRAAEDLMLGDISTGASNDIDRVTKIAHSMVARYGMSKKIGTLNYSDDQSQTFLGNSIGHSKAYSEDILKDIDTEMREIVRYCYDKAIEILKANKDILITLANVLMDKETIYKKEFEAICSGSYNPEDFKDEKLNIY
ncbi:MAG: ATP-dependent zinc metalloprotease FtsH [Ezakiella sp.]|nr:ATP-dependent zinc metalloprotease FtsH [Ezakiella sp.]